MDISFLQNFLNALPIILLFIVILSVLVLIHELGHFLTAKRFGIKVEEFGFGFPPKVFGKKRGETLYSFNALPIGGFVKLYGEDDAGSGKVAKGKKVEKDLDRAFFAKPIHKRIIVVVAGVVMNFLLAIIIATFLISTQGVVKDNQVVLVGNVAENSPASVAGFQKGDKIKSIDGVTIVSTTKLIETTTENLGQEVTIVLVRGDEEIVAILTPRVDPPEGEGAMGVSIDQDISIVKKPFPASIYYGVEKTITDSGQIVFGLRDMISSLVSEVSVPEGVAGPVGMAQLTGEVSKYGPYAILNLVYLLSLTLAILNILPIPALDGGRLLFLLIELVTRRKVNPKYEGYVHMAGIVVLLGLLALLTVNDVGRLIAGESILPQ